jgi:hypothetical protein
MGESSWMTRGISTVRGSWCNGVHCRHWALGGAVSHGSPGAHLHGGAGPGLRRHGATCCSRTSLGRRVRSGCSHGYRSTWDLRSLPCRRGRSNNTMGSSHVAALELSPVRGRAFRWTLRPGQPCRCWLRHLGDGRPSVVGYPVHRLPTISYSDSYRVLLVLEIES